MKVITYLSVCIIVLVSSVKIPEDPMIPKTKPSDFVLKKIRDNIFQLAEDKMKSADIIAKARNFGVLQEGAPKDMKEKAKNFREDKTLWNPIMKNPVDIFRSCVFPSYKVNFVKWCKNAFFGKMKKLKGISYLKISVS